MTQIAIVLYLLGMWVLFSGLVLENQKRGYRQPTFILVVLASMWPVVATSHVIYVSFIWKPGK